MFAGAAWRPGYTRAAHAARRRAIIGRVSTIAFFHAHPDDESSQTAGMMFRAARAGQHRVVLIIATDGRHGTPPASGEDIVSFRRGEVEASARVLGIETPRWLGYHDSGMLGAETNTDELALARADVGEASDRLLEILDDVGADILLGYDHHGGYGHPDHVQVHKIAVAAAQKTTRPLRLLFTSFSSTASAAQMDDPALLEVLKTEAPDLAAVFETMDPQSINIGSDGEPMGLDDADLRWKIVLDAEELDAKRRAMECHASQTSDVGMMLSLPRAIFDARFGAEYITVPEYVDARGTVGPPAEGWPFDS